MRAIEIERRCRARRFARARSSAWLGLALVGLALSCASSRKQPAPLATPPLDFEVRHFAGSALAGPLGSAPEAAIDPAPEHAFAVHCRFVYLDRFPPDALSSMLQSARLVVADRGNQAVVTPVNRGSSVRVAGGERALEFVDDLRAGRYDRTVDAGSVDSALPEGVTLVVSPTPREPSAGESGAPPAQRRVAALITRGRDRESSAISVLLAIDEPSAPAQPTASEEAEVAMPPPRWVVVRSGRRGVLLSEAPRVDGAPLVVVAPPANDRSASLALIVDVVHADARGELAAAHAQAFERCVSDVARENDEAARRAKLLSPNQASMNGLVCAVQALEIAGRHRAALAFLARSAEAPLAESLALGASEDSLARIVARLIEECGGSAALARVGPALGWQLESGAYRILAQWTLSGEITPDLSALLVRYAGEPARYPDELESAVASSRDVASLRERFVAENRRALDDVRPASRVCAFDWLAARGLAPQGYDPLASASERHAVLAREQSERDSAHTAGEASAKEPR